MLHESSIVIKKTPRYSRGASYFKAFFTALEYPPYSRYFRQLPFILPYDSKFQKLSAFYPQMPYRLY